jgi:magnesium transporter
MLKRHQIVDEKIKESCDGEGTISVYVNPDEPERRYLIDELRVDEHTLNSALDPDELARMEFEPQHLALIIKRPKYYSHEDNFRFKVNSLGLFIFPDKLIIVLADEQPVFDSRHFQKIHSVQDVALKLIFNSIFHFVGHLKIINMCSEEIEQAINTAMENIHLLDLFTLEKSLVYYINAISSNGRVIEKLRSNAAKISLTTENIELLEDIAIENSQCYEQTQTHSQVLSSLMDARVSIVSNNLNILMKRLNIIMIALMLPTLWISIFSMNVWIPFQESKWMFPVIVIISVIMAAAVVLVRGNDKRYLS